MSGISWREVVLITVMLTAVLAYAVIEGGGTSPDPLTPAHEEQTAPSAPDPLPAAERTPIEKEPGAQALSKPTPHVSPRWQPAPGSPTSILPEKHWGYYESSQEKYTLWMIAAADNPRDDAREILLESWPEMQAAWTHMRETQALIQTFQLHRLLSDETYDRTGSHLPPLADRVLQCSGWVDRLPNNSDVWDAINSFSSELYHETLGLGVIRQRTGEPLTEWPLRRLLESTVDTEALDAIIARIEK